ncbi:MAG TPA: VOC family protein [Devosiaceae bacterium]|jgi:uncharacterized glyoxalase superfamily protein PhnB
MDENTQFPTPKPGDEGYVTGVTPYVNISDANGAAAFYERAFGAKTVNKMPADDGKRLIHCHLVINGGPVMFSDFFPEHGYPLVKPQAFTLHLQVDDPQGWWDRAVAAGCTVHMPMAQQFWGDYYGTVLDPYGVYWSIGGKPKAQG